MTETSTPKRILIVGDWVVDEYWFLVRHLSNISSHTGFVHYRLSSPSFPQVAVADLCSAGHVARILYRLCAEADRKAEEEIKERSDYDNSSAIKPEKQLDLLKIWGIGNWNSKDTELLRHLMHANAPGVKCLANQVRFLSIWECCNKPPENVQLFTMIDDHSTIRVHRLYHHERGELQQINRIDWEPKSGGLEEKIREFAEKRLPGGSECKKESQSPSLPKRGEINAIVIHDLTKGAITTDLIDGLLKAYGSEVPWYVRSKDAEPGWLKMVKERGNLRLWVIGPEVAALQNPWGTWLTDKGKTTFQVYEIIRRMENFLQARADAAVNVVLLSDHREFVARLNAGIPSGEKDSDYFTAKSMVKTTPITQLGWSSAVFAALVYMMCGKGKNDSLKRDDIEKVLIWADEFGRIEMGNRDTPDLEPGYASPRVYVPSKEQPSKWQTENEQWEQARGKQGEFPENSQWKQTEDMYGFIKGSGGELRLDVWRGFTYLPNYVACIDAKCKIIGRIGQVLRSFMSDHSTRSRSLSILLQADPGAGKTFLARSLASTLDFAYLRFDVTQMIHRDDLVALFDTVATQQANDKRELLVFVDEINAKLDGSYVYGAFLAPLEDGVYIRGGQRFSLKPCVWIFAGTKSDEDRLEAGEKLNDFKSRMTMIGEIDYDSLLINLDNLKRDNNNPDKKPSREEILEYEKTLRRNARLEQVYLGAIMIRNYFPDVQEISREVLLQFHQLEPKDNPARTIERMAASLRNVKYGQVNRENCRGAREWEKVKWDDDDDKVMVKLYFE